MEVGKSVQARVLDIVKADGIVDLTLRPELLQFTEQETSTSESGRKKVCTKPGLMDLHVLSASFLFPHEK